MNYHKLFLIIIFFTTILNATSITLTQEEKEFIKSHPIITLGTDKGWEPYSIENADGTISGYDVDVLNLINNLTGSNFVIKRGNWKELNQEVKDKKIEGLSTGVINDEKSKYLVFSKTYLVLTKMIFTNINKKVPITTLEDLEGKVFAIYKSNAVANKIANSIKGIKLLKLDSVKDVINAVTTGKADAMLGNAAMVYILSKQGNPYLKPSIILDEKPLNLVFSIRKDLYIATSIIDKALDTIGEHKLLELKQYWFKINSNLLRKAKNNLSLTNEENQYLLEKQEVKMCIDPSWMPFEKLDKNGNHIGMSADFFKIFKKDLGINIKLVKTKTWDESLQFVKEKKCDVLSLAMETPERKKYLNFTSPYLKIPLVIATKINIPFIDNIELIQDKRIGIPKGYAFIEILKSKYSNLEIVEVENITDGLSKVNKGELFGYIGTLASIGYKFQKEFNGELQIAGKFEETWELGIGVRDDDKILLNILDKEIEQLSHKEQQKILNTWIAIKYEKGTDYTLIWQILALVLIIGLFFLYRQISLKKQNKNLKQLHLMIKEQNSELIKSKNKLNEVFEASGEGIWDWNVKTNYVGHNSTWYKILGLESDKDLINDFTTLIHPEDKEKVLKKINDTLSGNSQHYESEHRLFKKNGEIIWVMDKGRIVEYENDSNPLRMAGSFSDITERKKVEAKLEEQHIKLINSEKLASMGEMIGNIAHQWRQPLSVISTASTGIIIQKEYGILNEDELIKTCNHINDNAQYLSKTIDDFTNFIKGDSESVKFSLKNDTDSFLKLVDSTIKNNHIDVILNLTEDIRINGYPNELIQCFINIFNNAKDALIENNQEGDRYIFISQETVNSNVVIKFKDNAGGIPSDVIRKVFEPYFTTKHQSQGTGLGLHMTYNLIVDSMNGTIEVNNINYKYNGKECVGAEFTITLPLESNNLSSNYSI